MIPEPHNNAVCSADIPPAMFCSCERANRGLHGNLRKSPIIRLISLHQKVKIHGTGFLRGRINRVSLGLIGN